jgi:hypothetical protein
LDDGRSIPLAAFSIASDIGATFGEVDRSGLDRLVSNVDPYSLGSLDGHRGCSLIPPSYVAPYFRFQSPPRVWTSWLDAGDRLRARSSGLEIELSKGGLVNWQYAARDLMSIPIDPVEWSVSGLGGTFFGPFDVSVLLPAVPRPSNEADLRMLSRDHDQVVSWDPSVYGDVESVTVTLYDSMATFASVIRCAAPAREGTLTLPAELLSQLRTEPFSKWILRTEVIRRSDAPIVFNIPVVAGGQAPAVLVYRLEYRMVIDVE